MALVIVKPDTVVAWHRRGFRLWWTWKSRHRTGRPTVPADIRTLIRTIAQSNPRWGAPRIHGELLKLGIDICQATVAKYMRGRRSRRRVGRPMIGCEIRMLVRKMATANPLWGAPRIHGELRTRGIDVSERSVSRLLKRRSRPASQTWRTFLANHLGSPASMDFFTVPTVTGRVLFVLLILSHRRRRIVHVNITAHPTAI